MNNTHAQSRERVLMVCLGLAAITFAVFGQTASFSFINFDDNVYVYENPHVTAGLTEQSIRWVFSHPDCSFYHPLTMLSLMVDYQLYGLRAGGYHLTNVFLHAASAIILFLVLREMTGSFWRGAFVAAVFAVHPLRAEAVAWVAQRKEVLAGFFFMVTLAAYAWFARKPNSPFRYLTVIAAFILALLSKPTVVTLPFVLLLLDYWPLGRSKHPGIVPRLIWEKVPLLALALGASVMTVATEGKWIAANAHVPLGARLANSGVSYVEYLRQMFWPTGLAVPYPFVPGGTPGWQILVSAALLIAVTLFVLTKSRSQPWLLVGWLWFLGMFVPMIGLLQVGAFSRADRYTYLPQIGLYLAISWTLAELHLKRRTAAVLMSAVVVALMASAWSQTSCWATDESLWSHSVAFTKNNTVAMSNLGADYLRNGKIDQAVALYNHALRTDPDNAESHNNYGLALLQEGKLDDAISHFQRSLELNPGNASAHLNLGSALRRQGKIRDAISQLQAALQIDPDDVEALNNLAWLLATGPQATLRNGEKATELAIRASQLTRGQNPVVLRTLAAALAEASHFQDAAETARHAIDMANTQGNTRLSGELQSDLEFYERGQSYHSGALH